MYLYRRPKAGTYKTGTKFAYLPKKLSNGDVIWLRKYHYSKVFDYKNIFSSCLLWQTLKVWVEE